jgi:hypothetical protein
LFVATIGLIFVAKFDIHIQSWVIKCLLNTLRP